ncbi:MAG: acyltransferase [Bacteroidota bacterium]
MGTYRTFEPYSKLQFSSLSTSSKSNPFLKSIFSIPSLDNSRLAWIDYAKGISITMIIFRHVTFGLAQQPGVVLDDPFLELVDQIGLTFRMPLYFMLSGIFFTRSFEKRGLGGYTIHKLKSIMYPYSVWYLSLMLIQLSLSSYVNAQYSTAYDFLRFFYNPWGHWWFLYALFGVSILYLLLFAITKGQKWILIGLGIGASYLAYLQGDTYIFDDILKLFVFFAFGDLIARYATTDEVMHRFSRLQYLIPIIMLAIAGEILLFGTLRNSVLANILFAFVGVVCASLLCYRLAKSDSKWLGILRLLGQHSLYIYLLHPFTNGAVRTVLYRVLNVDNTSILIATGFIAGLLGPIVVFRILSYFKLGFLFYPSFKKTS